MAGPIRASLAPRPLGVEGPLPLLPRIAAGDAAAVRECLDRYGRLVYSLARRFLREPGEVEDACQEIFTELWKNAASFDEARASEVTFVAMVSRRRLIDRQRALAARGQGQGASAAREHAAEPTVSEASIENYVDARIAATALEACSEDQRRVIVLAACQGFSHEQIAAELSMPLGTVKSHYTRGIERVRRALAEREVNR